jgi:hypothetical protein
MRRDPKSAPVPGPAARHDKPVARLVREVGPNLADIRLGVAGLRELQARIQKRTHGKARLSDAEVRVAIGEGRT